MKQRLVSVSGTNALRSLLAVTALFVAGLFVPASAGAEGPATSASPTSASQAQVVLNDSPPAVFIGFVFRDEDGVLASKVRAIGANGAVCGTASVRTLSNGEGFYRLEAVGADTREGCPGEGGALAFRLLYGNVDSGSFAITSQTVRFASGDTSVVSLTPPPTSSNVDWIGEVTLTSGDTLLLTWVGLDGASVQDALASLDVSVDRVTHYDADRGKWVSYTVDGPSFLQTYTVVQYGDVVRVRLR